MIFSIIFFFFLIKKIKVTNLSSHVIFSSTFVVNCYISSRNDKNISLKIAEQILSSSRICVAVKDNKEKFQD